MAAKLLVNLGIVYMMRFFIITTFLFVLVSCVKKPSTNPVPQLEYKNAYGFGLTSTGGDTAVVVVGYEDGDGNLFVDDYSQGPNLIMTTYYYNSDSAKFLKDRSFSNTVKQPDNGYYKGKSIKGDIYLPLREFRSNNTRKIIKFNIFMKDMKSNVANTVSSPVYTLNF